MKMGVIYCIIGRTASGKDHWAKELSKRLNIPIIVSYTTRPKRNTETDGVEHIFITDKEADEVLVNENRVVAYTKIGEYRYFTLIDQFKNNNDMIYIIDPIGLERLKEKLEDKFTILSVYVDAKYQTRLKRALTRSNDIEEVFEKRNDAEDLQFNLFEKYEMWDFYLDNNVDI